MEGKKFSEFLFPKNKYALYPKPLILNPKPETRNPKPETLSPKPCTLNPGLFVGWSLALCVLLLLTHALQREREFFIDNFLVRIRLIIEMILVDRPYAMGV